MTKLRRDMTWLEKLQELRRMASFEDASFGGAGVELKPGEVTDFIRERTKLYRQSWVTPIIDELIERELRARRRRKGKQR